MVTVKGRKIFLNGKDLQLLKRGSKETGLSIQDFFTGICWEMVMRQARLGVFLVKNKTFKKD